MDAESSVELLCSDEFTPARINRTPSFSGAIRQSVDGELGALLVARTRDAD